jgi:hypothetical protein
MGKTAAATLFVVIGCASAPQARIADVVCDTTARLETRLETQYGARLQGRGVRAPDTVLEVWSVERSSDWLLVQTYVDGRSCIVAMGDDWENMATPSQGPA